MSELTEARGRRYVFDNLLWSQIPPLSASNNCQMFYGCRK